MDIKTIYDSNGQKIFEFYIGTLLDFIFDDLWSDISKYMNYNPLALDIKLIFWFNKI